jgi:hypothetical protein
MARRIARPAARLYHPVPTLLSLTARLLRPQARAEDMKRRESRLKPLIALYRRRHGPARRCRRRALATPRPATSTPATRPQPSCAAAGLIARDAAGVERLSQLSVGEDYLGGGAHSPRHAARSRGHLPRHPSTSCSISTRTRGRPICPPRPKDGRLRRGDAGDVEVVRS